MTIGQVKIVPVIMFYKIGEEQMKYYPKKQINLDKFPEDLAIELINFYLKTVGHYDLNNSPDGLDPRDQYNTNTYDLLSITDDNPDFYLGVSPKNLDEDIKYEIENNLYLYLKDADESLQNKLALECSEPTAELYYLRHDDDFSEVGKISAKDLNSYLEPEYTTRLGVRPRFALDGNIVWEYDQYSGAKNIFEVFDTCADAEIYIMEYIEDSSFGSLWFEYTKGMLEDVINNVFDDENSDSKTVKKRLLKELQNL